MEADSTTTSNLRSWNSPETLDVVQDQFYVYQICKLHEDPVIKDAKNKAERDNESIIFAKSKIFLLC